MALLDTTNLNDILGVFSSSVINPTAPTLKSLVLSVTDLSDMVGVSSSSVINPTAPTFKSLLIPVTNLSDMVGVSSSSVVNPTAPTFKSLLVSVTDLSDVMGILYIRSTTVSVSPLQISSTLICTLTLDCNVFQCNSSINTPITLKATLALYGNVFHCYSAISTPITSPKKIIGHVSDGNNGGNALSRKIVAFPRNDPTIIYNTTSSPSTGNYEFLIYDFPPGYFCVVGLDDNTSSNALVLDWIYLS